MEYKVDYQDSMNAHAQQSAATRAVDTLRLVAPEDGNLVATGVDGVFVEDGTSVPVPVAVG